MDRADNLGAFGQPVRPCAPPRMRISSSVRVIQLARASSCFISLSESDDILPLSIKKCATHLPGLINTPTAMSPLRRQNPREEPGALAAHAGICAGGGQQWPSLPRPFSALGAVCLTRRLVVAGSGQEIDNFRMAGRYSRPLAGAPMPARIISWRSGSSTLARMARLCRSL